MAHSAKSSFCEKIIKLPFLPEITHQFEMTVLDHPPVFDKKILTDQAGNTTF